MSEEQTGVDLNTVLMSESDGACGVTHVAPPEEVAVQREMHKLSDPVMTDEEAHMMKTLSGVKENPDQALLREAKRHTEILYSINRYAFSAAVLCVGLVVVAMTTMIIISIGLR